MNAKRAKRLRRVARLRSVGLPKVAYVGVEGRGRHRGKIVAFAVDPRSTRGVYLGLKRAA